MIIEWAPDIILEDWVEINYAGWWHRQSKIDQQCSFTKVSIYYETYTIRFWDELKWIEKYYQPKTNPNLSIEELKVNVDHFLLRMIELKALL